jgi:hypothetical protein
LLWSEASTVLSAPRGFALFTDPNLFQMQRLGVAQVKTQVKTFLHGYDISCNQVKQWFRTIEAEIADKLLTYLELMNGYGGL